MADSISHVPGGVVGRKPSLFLARSARAVNKAANRINCSSRLHVISSEYLVEVPPIRLLGKRPPQAPSLPDTRLVIGIFKGPAPNP